MYLAFCLKKYQLDKESILADQFSRLDMIDAISKDGFFNQFIEVLKLLREFDVAFCSYDIAKKIEPQKFYSGKSIFDSQPSCVGFMAAAAQHIWGLPGMDRSKSEVSKARAELFSYGKENLKAIQGKSPDVVRDFLDLSTLNQVLTKPQSGKIGEFERSLFFSAYKILFSNKLRNMTPCWRA